MEKAEKVIFKTNEDIEAGGAWTWSVKIRYRLVEQVLVQQAAAKIVKIASQ